MMLSIAKSSERISMHLPSGMHLQGGQGLDGMGSTEIDVGQFYNFYMLMYTLAIGLARETWCSALCIKVLRHLLV